jgi:anti-anti-sigma factor
MPGHAFSAVFEPSEAWATVVCRGDLDAPEGDQVRSAFDAALASDPDMVVLDCRQVGFVGSYGLKVLLDALMRGEEEGVEVVLLAGPEVRRLFDVIGVPLEESHEGPLGAHRTGPLVQRPVGRAPRSYRHEWANPDPEAGA